MSHFNGKRTGDEFMVRGLVFDPFFVFSFFKYKSRAEERGVQDHIDLIERQPVCDILPESFK